MLKYRFTSTSESGVSGLDWLSRTTGTEHKTGYLVNFFNTDQEATTAFLAKVADAIAGGQVETEPSLSRRVFVHNALGKVWIVSLDENDMTVNFGRDPRGMFAQPGGRWGTEKTTHFPSREEALTAYHKVIEEKRKKGYTEFFPRQTAYSKAPVAKKVSKKSPVKKSAKKIV